MPEVQVVVPAVPSHWQRMQQACVKPVCRRVQLVQGQSHDVLAACDCT
jgi:lipid-A-disaccharide synthase